MAATFGRTAADLYNGIDDMLSDGIDALETGLADEFSSGGRSVRSGKGISKKNMTKVRRVRAPRIALLTVVLLLRRAPHSLPFPYHPHVFNPCIISFLSPPHNSTVTKYARSF